MQYSILNDHVLCGSRCYLIGSIENDKDLGVSWRREAQIKLAELGIISFNPCDKPFIRDLSETKELNQNLKELRGAGEFDELSSKMREIRNHDLRLVDLSDFVFCYLDRDCPSCGSWEEIFLANRHKKPIVFVYKQGIKNIPLWLFGVTSHSHFFDTVDDAVQFLSNLTHDDLTQNKFPRWKLLRPEFRQSQSSTQFVRKTL